MQHRLVWVAAVVLVAAAAVGGWWWTDREAARDAAARAALASYVDGWRARDMSAVPFAAEGAAADFAAATAALRSATVTVEAGPVRRDGDTATADLTLAWTLPGGLPWTYTTPARLVEDEQRWLVAGPADGSPWHPDLRAGETMRLERTAAERGDLLDRRGEPLALEGDAGQPLLGTVGPASAEAVEASEGRLVEGDDAGRGGLQGQYDETLGGVSGESVVSSSGRTLFVVDPVPGDDVRTTLDPSVQAAAESALTAADLEAPGALVAVDVPTGHVLAVANRPTSGFDRALTGRYPPGSTFKIASSYAFLTRGVTTPTSVVPCPRTETIDGRAFRNAEGGSIAGEPTFAEDFAQSCNTAFVALSRELGPADLTTAAAALGIGDDWAEDLGVEGAFPGSVPPTRAGTDRAAATIGQGRTEVSPLALAVMAGSIGRGTYVPPALVLTTEGGPRPTPLDGRAVGQLRAMMADVVTSGSATVLRGTPGGAVRGKTGTAEHGVDEPPHTWFTGYQGDVAFAVLVEEGESGGATAAPVAKRFLTTLATG